MGDENPIRTLGDYSKPSHKGYRNTIELLVGNNVVPLRSNTIRRTIDQSAGGKLRDLNAEESWALLEDLALYDNESWNDRRDFAKPVKAIALPQDVLSTSGRHLIELKNQTKWEVRGSLRTMDQEISMIPPTPGRRNQTSTGHIPKPSLTRKADRYPSTPLQDDMIGKINVLWKTISENLNDASPPKNARNSMAPKSIAATSHDERKELKKKGIKSLSKLLSPKYLSPASIKELNKNMSALKRVHFINSIVILSTDSDTEEEDVSSTNACDLNLGEEESEFETNEEVEDVLKEEAEDEDGENFNLFPTMEELTHHEWLLKNPRPPWV
ncbi:hypothetical protein Tco_0269652 [Tanacetum coccineum]